jgi:hypothetical protein
MMRRCLFAFSLFALVGHTMGAHAMEPHELFDKLSPSVWTVSNYDGRSRVQSMGSAVTIAPGRLVTNCHVLEKGVSFTVDRENVSYGATVEFMDPERDLCQLKVAGFEAAPVEIADSRELKVGARVYAIGSPRGLEMTLSDGLISVLRRTEDGSLVLIQTSAPVSPGSSGGGLFDAAGRLIGITTFQRKDSQNLNFAVPSGLIGELPERHRLREARRAPRTGDESPGAEARAFVADQRRAGDWFEYRLVDTYTNLARTFTLAVERVTSGRVIYGGGARIEGLFGELIEGGGGLLGELDALTPSRGWAEQVKDGANELEIASKLGTGDAVRFNLTVTARSEEKLKVGTQEYAVSRVDLQGWTYRTSHISGVAQPTSRYPYRASVWYAPDLRRVVRFSYATRGTRERLELVNAGNR